PRPQRGRVPKRLPRPARTRDRAGERRHPPGAGAVDPGLGRDPVRRRLRARPGAGGARAGRLQRLRRRPVRAARGLLRGRHRDLAPARRGAGDAGGGRAASVGGDVRVVDRTRIAVRAPPAGRRRHVSVADAPTVDAATAARIAAAFAPPRWYGSRAHCFYARAKLRSGPLDPGVVEALRGTTAPLLDLGCGIGLLAHALRAAGLAMPYRGVDNDARKIAAAQRAGAKVGLADVAFDCVDLAAGVPAHRGSVAILDVLQFVPPEAQDAILDAAVAMLVPGAKLVIRTGLDDGSARARTTRRIDALSRLLGWMDTGPKRYPAADALRARCAGAGLAAEFTPLHGNTPFNNWRVVATKL